MRKVPEKWMVIVAVLLGTFTIILNNSMLNPALPFFMGLFQEDAVAVGWLVTIFMVAMGMIMPVTGYLADKFGKKHVFMAGLLVFVVGSALASVSWSLSSLIFFRAVQGAAGGVMMPLSMALIFDAFPREERGLATGIWGVAAMVAPTIGPTLGGVIVETSSWHYLFLLNIPFGILGLFASAKYLKTEHRKGNAVFDRWGFITVTAGVGAILFALARMKTLEDLTDSINYLLVGFGLISLWVFVRHENRTAQPLLNLSVFKVPTYTLTVWITAANSIGMFAGIFLIPLLIQNVYGMNAIVTGLVFLPAAMLGGIFMTVGGRILDIKGPRGVITVGTLIFAVTTIALGILDMETSVWYITLIMAIRGIGMGLSNMPATTAGMNAIPDRLVAQGSAMNNVLRQISSSLGIVFMSVYYEVRRAQLFAAGTATEAASLQAINEGFLVVGVLIALTIPAGWMIQHEVKEKAPKSKQVQM